MKKISIIVLIASTLLLSGCGKTGQDMSFSDAYGVLKSHNIFASKTYTTPDNTKVLHDETVIDFSIHASQGFAATGTLKSEGTYNLPEQKGGVDMNLSIDTLAFEPSFGENIRLTGSVQFVQNSGQAYGRINGFSLTPAKEAGNVEGGVINALIHTISKKWIQVSEGTEKSGLVPYRKNIIEFLHQFNIGRNKHSLFKEIGKDKIDGYTAYKIGWDEEGVKSFVQHILQDAKNIGAPIAFDGATMDEAIQGIVSSPIEGYLIIKSSKDIVLRIDSVTTQDSGILGFVYSKDGLFLTLKNLDNSLVATGDVQLKGKELSFNLSIPNNNFSIEGQTQDNQNKTKITIKSSEFILHTMIMGNTSTLESFAPIVVTGSTPLKQIIEGFSILSQGMNESPSDDTGVSSTP